MKYHTIAFQVYGSSHVCSFLRILDAPVNNVDEYIQFTDGFAKEFVSDVNKKPGELFHLVTSHIRNKKMKNVVTISKHFLLITL